MVAQQHGKAVGGALVLEARPQAQTTKRMCRAVQS